MVRNTDVILLFFSALGALALGSLHGEGQNEVGNVNLEAGDDTCLGKLVNEGPVSYRLCLDRLGKVKKSGLNLDAQVCLH